MNVIDMGKRPPQKTAPTLTSKFGHDGEYLEMCARWHILRAEQQLNWAEHSLATGFNTLPDEGIDDVDTEPLEKMKRLEEVLAIITPKTALLAQEMLDICITILSHPDPASNLGRGPVLEIVKNVKVALDWLPPGTKLEGRK